MFKHLGHLFGAGGLYDRLRSVSVLQRVGLIMRIRFNSLLVHHEVHFTDDCTELANDGCIDPVVPAVGQGLLIPWRRGLVRRGDLRFACGFLVGTCAGLSRCGDVSSADLTDELGQHLKQVADNCKIGDLV